MRITYYLSIDTPDVIDHDLQEEIVASSEPHDRTWQDRVARWLGGPLSTVEGALSDSLPEGWSARIDSAPGVTVRS